MRFGLCHCLMPRCSLSVWRLLPGGCEMAFSIVCFVCECIWQLIARALLPALTWAQRLPPPVCPPVPQVSETTGPAQRFGANRGRWGSSAADSSGNHPPTCRTGTTGQLLVWQQAEQGLVGLEKQPLRGQLQATSVLPGAMSSFCLDLQDPWVWEGAVTASSCNSCCQVEEEEEEEDEATSWRRRSAGRVSKLYTVFPFSHFPFPIFPTQLIPWCSKYSNVLPREEEFGCSWASHFFARPPRCCCSMKWPLFTVTIKMGQEWCKPAKLPSFPVLHCLIWFLK